MVHSGNTLNSDRVQALWADLNVRFFRGALAPIQIEWSTRLTSSAGMFVCRTGPRARGVEPGLNLRERRVIRLSAPLLGRASAWAEGTLASTLAHEMIHQWQFDLLRRRPNHGPDFCRKMTEMNHEGVGISIRHELQDAVRALTKYAWRCQRCGRAYERQRRTIRPGRHRCGACWGPLRELGPEEGKGQKVKGKCVAGKPVQMELDFLIS